MDGYLSVTNFNNTIICYGKFQTLQGDVWYDIQLPTSYTTTYCAMGSAASNNGVQAAYGEVTWNMQNPLNLSVVKLGSAGTNTTWWVSWMTIGY